MADIGPQRNFPETSMRDFYNVLFRHKRKIIVFFVSVMIVVTLGVFFGSRVYRSEAELLVRLGRENATVGPTVATGKVINITADQENQINSEVDILKSRELAEKVVDAVGAKLILRGAKETLPPGASLPTAVRYWVRRAVKFPFTMLSSLLSSSASTPDGRMLEKDLAIHSLMKHLDVEASKKSNIITITYETNDPALARNVLNRLVGFYLEKHIEVNRTPGSYAFFKKQRNELQSSLNQTEEELKNLKNTTDVASVSEQRTILLDRIGGMQTELANTESSIAASQARVKALTATLARLPLTVRKDETTGFANSAADSMRKQVYQLELKEQTLLSTFTENSIPVQEIRRQISQGKALLLKAQQQNQLTTGINVNYQNIQLALLTEQGSLASLQAKESALESQLKSAQIALDALNDTELRFQQLNRELATQRASYRKYSDSLEQARIDEALNMDRISNISIVQPASYSIKPVRPRKLLDLALGFFLGIFGALGLAFFSEFQDHTIKKPEDAANRLHLPVLATLPAVFPESAVDAPALANAGPPQLQAGSELLLAANGNSGAIGDLLRQCGRGTADTGPRAIALVGCHSGEGASTVAALLARQLAKSCEGRVLLIDANSHSPCQHLKFTAKLSPGLDGFGSNGRPALSSIQPTEVENLDVLCAGNAGQDLSPNVLKAFSEALPALKREYNAIICDLPPVLEHTETMRIAAMMDGVVLVVEAEKTRREVAEKAKETLAQADANVLGVILNKRRFHIPDWLYRTL